MDFEKEAREIVLQIERQLYFADATQTLTESLRRAFNAGEESMRESGATNFEKLGLDSSAKIIRSLPATDMQGDK